MRENKTLLLKLMAEVIQDLNLDIKSIDFYENLKQTMFGTETELIIKLRWWDNGNVTYGRYFSFTDVQILKRDPYTFTSFISSEIRKHIKEVKGELHE